jgi:hypothetical protein
MPSAAKLIARLCELPTVTTSTWDRRPRNAAMLARVAGYTGSSHSLAAQSAAMASAPAPKNRRPVHHLGIDQNRK